MSNLKQFFTYGSSPTKNSFPELPNYVTWFRLIIATLYALHLGATNQYGGIGLFLGLSIITLFPLSFVDLYLKGKADSYDKLTFVGVPNSLALLALVWIGIWTLNHPELESNLSSKLVLVKKIVETASITEIPAAETEF